MAAPPSSQQPPPVKTDGKAPPADYAGRTSLATALVLQGRSLLDCGQTDEAIPVLRRACALAPVEPQTHLCLGGALLRAGEPEAALECLRRAAMLAPEDADTLHLLATALCRAERHGEAVDVLRRAVGKRPDHAGTWVLLGRSLMALKRGGLAIEAFGRARELLPDDVKTGFELAQALVRTDRMQAARTLLEDLVRQAPDDYLVADLYGRVLRDFGELDRSLAAYDHALALQPDHPDIRLNRSLTLLSMGRFDTAWDEYDYRVSAASEAVNGFPPPEAWERHCPRWRGEPLGGRRVAVFGEQGPGDIVMFAQCLPDLIAEAAAVQLFVEHRLVALLARSFPQARVSGYRRLAEALEQPFSADFVLPIGSLPRRYRLAEVDFPARPRYLATDAGQVAAWTRRLAALGDGLKVGLSWRGGAFDAEVYRRQTALDGWLPLLQQRGCRFVSLQYGECAAEVAKFNAAHGIGHGPLLTHWPEVDPVGAIDDFAALVDALDLVVSIANTTVHFAGALGKPVWNLTPAKASWRWMFDRADSPWYPTMRILRQAHDEAWAEFMPRAAAEIAAAGVSQP
jgi:cytochrome c-type biogenesis protein CcmH/NrfG